MSHLAGPIYAFLWVEDTKHLSASKQNLNQNRLIYLFILSFLTTMTLWCGFTVLYWSQTLWSLLSWFHFLTTSILVYIDLVLDQRACTFNTYVVQLPPRKIIDPWPLPSHVHFIVCFSEIENSSITGLHPGSFQWANQNLLVKRKHQVTRSNRCYRDGSPRTWKTRLK